ncbi:low molecular weight phosphatase family protein [Ochrovirga pacifica]|uniref:protein-tyrosine-phosphatase n=1 Tax=Ochrovirga pacifica TaxID=1042376 RepID=UPI0002557B85|nr:protein-tyrosine-phosphatase [Ochrovirga pacifica]
MTTIPQKNVKDLFEKAINTTKLTINREHILQDIANKIAEILNNKRTVNLNFICTHNSRRSLIAQTWAYYAMEYYGITNGYSFSGGTEATCFHANTLKTLEASGFKFSLEEFSHKNPKYIINYKDAEKEIIGFSKLVDHSINSTPFLAITTCNDADENCPVILDAEARFHLPYKDPKVYDDTENQKQAYLETSLLIAAEMGILFNKVKQLVKS